MTPYQEAQATANEIAKAHYAGMFVSFSDGCEYCNSYDVEADIVAASQPQTTKQLIQAVQKRLNELGATPRLSEDGILGPLTLTAILTALQPHPQA